MKQEYITLDKVAFDNAIEELKSIDRFSSGRAGVGKIHKYSVENTDMLTIACMANAALTDLLSFIKEDKKC